MVFHGDVDLFRLMIQISPAPFGENIWELRANDGKRMIDVARDNAYAYPDMFKLIESRMQENVRGADSKSESGHAHVPEVNASVSPANALAEVMFLSLHTIHINIISTLNSRTCYAVDCSGMERYRTI